MADGPLNASAISTIVGLCPECCGAVLTGCGCQRCGWLPGVDRLSPSFNHTREDSPLAPCSECAALMSHADLAAAYRAALDGLLEMVQGDDPTHRCRPDSIAPCCFAQRLLKNTAQRDVQAVQVVQAERQAAGGAGPAGAAAGVPAGLALGVGETIDVFIDDPDDGRPSVVTAVGETCLLAKVPRVGEMQIPLSAAWWRRRGKQSVVSLPAGGQVGRAP